MKIKKLRKLIIATTVAALMLIACGKEKNVTSTTPETQAETTYEVQTETTDAVVSETETDSEPVTSEPVSIEIEPVETETADATEETTEPAETVTESETKDVSDLTPVEQLYKQLSDAFPQTKGHEEEILFDAYSISINDESLGLDLNHMTELVNSHPEADDFKLVSDSSVTPGGEAGWTILSDAEYVIKYEKIKDTNDMQYLDAVTVENTRAFFGTCISVQDNTVFMWNCNGLTKTIEL